MRMIKLRSVQSTHSLWKNWRVLATYMRRMRYNNLEIRIAGSSCRPQLISFFYFFQITAVFRSISQIVEQSFRSSHQRSTLLILFILKSVQNQIAEYWKTGKKNNDNKKVLKTNVTKRSFVDTKQSQITVVFAFFVVVFCLFVCLFVCYIRLLKQQKVYKVHTNLQTIWFFFSFPRYQYVRLDGTMSIKKRQKIVDRFNDPHVSGSQETLSRFSSFFFC